MPVGSHPRVTELLKGIFNTHPPLRNLCPSWDVGIVLSFLKQDPFCPIELCTLKFLTLKVCMLLALSSARRADDISKLSCRPQKCVLKEKKIVLTPDALLKQDRKGHVGEPIEIESFDDKDLDIVKILPFYLQKVKNLRVGDILLVMHVKPYKKPTAQTISRWIVQLVELAYEN